ncbi:auxin efflux carrier [Tribonema minus]|uniref:Auxin efflux carrier n=1 Tax=Tribonema minus TaxID=303371 RepID=A0A836CLT3_9STRA|nr:auxin efflux carrier [Tribonema minus]
MPPLFLQPTVVASSVRAVAELLTCCVFGVTAAKKGVLTPTNVSALSQIVYNIFLPSLLLVNVAETAISQPLSTLLPIPLFAWAQIFIGYKIARLTMKVLRIEPTTEEGREVQVCSAFGNSGILPLLFVNALFRAHPDPTVLPRAIAYISFFLMGWSPAFWTVGYRTLTTGIEPENEEEPALAAGSTATAAGSQATVAAAGAQALSKAQTALASPALKRILSPPIVACLVGLTVGISSPLRWLLTDSNAPLAFLWNSIKVLAAAYTPSGILVLAGSLANAKPQNIWTKATAKKIAAISMARWLLLPIATGALLLGCVKARIVPRDPALLFVLMMEAAMPPAQNSVIILQVSGLRNAAGRIARSLCIFYLVGVLPISALLTVFLQACGLS